MTTDISQNPWNNLTTPEGAPPTDASGTPAASSSGSPPPSPPTTIVQLPTVPAAKPTRPLATYEAFNVFMDDAKGTTAEDIAVMIANLKLGPYDEFCYFVRRAPTQDPSS